MSFNLEKLLKDISVGNIKRETIYKGSSCTRYELAECLFDSAHVNNDACLFQYESGAVAYKCQHNSCKEKVWKDAKEDIKEKYHIKFKDYWSGSDDTSEVKAGREEITYLSGADVIANPVEIEWIIIGMMAMDESVLIHAKGGLGKSMFILYLILVLGSFKNTIKSLFTGFLGEKSIITKQRCSLVLGAENGRVTTYQRLKKMCNGSSDLEDGLKNIFFLSKYDDTTITGEVFLDEIFCDFLVKFIKQIEEEQNIKIELLVIDPLISFSGVKNENDSADMRPALDAIDRVCKQVGCTPLVVHHDKKDGDNYRGASAVNDWTRNRISLKRQYIAEQRATEVDSMGKPTKLRTAPIPVIRVSHEKCNNFQMFDPFLVKMTHDLNFERVEEQLNPEQLEKADTVVQALKDMQGFAESTNALAQVYQDLTGCSKNTAKSAIAIAVDNGMITREPVKIKGKNGYQFKTK